MIEPILHGIDHLARLRQDVAVEHARLIDALPRPHAIDIGVESEEVIGVPDRQDRLAHRPADISTIL